MRNIGMAILASGLLVGMAGAATAQNVASAVPAPTKEYVVFTDRGSELFLRPRRPSCVPRRVKRAVPGRSF